MTLADSASVAIDRLSHPTAPQIIFRMRDLDSEVKIFRFGADGRYDETSIDLALAFSDGSNLIIGAAK